MGMKNLGLNLSGARSSAATGGDDAASAEHPGTGASGFYHREQSATGHDGDCLHRHVAANLSVGNDLPHRQMNYLGVVHH